MKSTTFHPSSANIAVKGKSPSDASPSATRHRNVSSDDLACHALLLAEDNVHTRLVRMVLSEHEILVATAANVEEASNAVASHIPDVVLLDWDIDGLDGRSILRVVKKSPQSRHVPVLVMTNRAITETMKRELLMLGVQWILEKPIVPLSLPRLIKRTIADGIPSAQADGLFQRRIILVDCGQTASGAMLKSVW